MKTKNLKDISVYHLHLDGEAPHVAPDLAGHIHVKCFFVGANCREAVQAGRASYVPVFLSEIGKLFREGVIALDWALVQISPFDKHGFATLGPSVDVSITALHCARHVVAQINQHMPRVLGDGVVHQKDIDWAIEHHTHLHEVSSSTPDQVVEKIGHHVASLIEDGATLQMGIGDIPNAVLKNLTGHRHLGIHTEMFSDGVIDLVNRGAIDNSRKKIHPHRMVSSFAMGTQTLYNFLDDNPMILFLASEYVNDPRVIQKNPNVCAINSALEIDLSGQVCADSIGHRIYSGVGGQVDFLRGAALSPGGKSIIALPSATRKGTSKLVNTLASGAGVVSSRAHVRFVVTEWGLADLQGKTIHERAKALIGIAHPEHRDQLTAQAKKLGQL